MTAISAKPEDGRAARVVILVYPGVTLLDVTGPAQVFSTAREIGGTAAAYEVLLASNAGPSVATDTGVGLSARSLENAAARPIDTLIVAGGSSSLDACEDAALVAWIARQARRARRIGSTCTGAFLMGAAGMLAGRKVTTHWQWCERLRRLHPDAEVVGDPIFVNDRGLWSAGGVTAGIDMALAMVEEDHGFDLALKVAQNLVVFLKRPGGQSQFSATLKAQLADKDGFFDGLHGWISANLAADLRVEPLAERAGMSPRTFARSYAARMGTTPAKAVEQIRVDGARHLLELDAAPLAEIARRCGFRDIERMRRAFLRSLQITPSQYRRRFSIATDARASAGAD
jgi:transcriptional regulator GlxA family with amidase domain